MNRYEATTANGVAQPPPKVPGWTDWEAILGGGYNGWGFKSTRLDERATSSGDHPKPALHRPGEIDEAYATNVAADKAIDFIERHRDEGAPYFLEVAVYGPHSQLDAAYPDQPQFPSAMADRAPAGEPTGGNCGLEGVRRPDARRPGRVRRPARRQRAHLPATPTAPRARLPPGAPTRSCSPTRRR